MAEPEDGAGDTCRSEPDADRDCPGMDLDAFIERMADVFSLDRPCRVCQAISECHKKYQLTAEWVADYAMLCHKSLAAPLCATSTYIATFEWIYVMDKHHLVQHGVTMVGALARRVVTIGDVQKHFFLNGCFKTVRGGLASKIDLNNYSFLVQSVVRYALMTCSTEPGSGPALAQGLRGAAINPKMGGPATGQVPGHNGTAVALLKWREYARPLECFRTADSAAAGRKTTARRVAGSCVTLAEQSDERAATDADASVAEGGRGSRMTSPSEWAYADLTTLLLSGTSGLPAAGLCPVNGPDSPIVRLRCETVESFHRTVVRTMRADVVQSMQQFSSADARPAVSMGPVLASTLPHTSSRGGTGGECALCNLLLTRAHRDSLRKFRAKVVGYHNTNTGLFDGIEPLLDDWGAVGEENDDGRLLTLLRAAGPHAIYKHFFCDPLCAINSLRVDPEVMWGVRTTDADEIELFKAELAARNVFVERVCHGLWILAFAFKAYQLAPPRPTAMNTFIREAEGYLRKHGLSCIALELALTKYV